MKTERTGELYIQKRLQRALLLIGQRLGVTGDSVAEDIIESHLEQHYPKLIAALKVADEDWMKFQREQQAKLEEALRL